LSKNKLVLGGFLVGALVAGAFVASKNEKVRSNVKKITGDNDNLKNGLVKGKELSKETYLKSKDVTKKVLVKSIAGVKSEIEKAKVKVIVKDKGNDVGTEIKK
jgi:hypothetical protein